MQSLTDYREGTFLTRIRNSLRIASDDTRHFSSIFPPLPEVEIQKIQNSIVKRTSKDQKELFQKLEGAAKPINLKVAAADDVAAVSNAILKIVRTKNPEWGQKKHVALWDHPLLDQLKLADRLRDDDIIVHSTTHRASESNAEGLVRIRKAIKASFVGITTADYCVAESATLVMKTQAGQARSISLLPTIHIVVIRMDQIIANLEELYVLLTSNPAYEKDGISNCLTFISGPSKTADIEAVMVHGAHGPRELHLFVLTGNSL